MMRKISRVLFAVAAVSMTWALAGCRNESSHEHPGSEHPTAKKTVAEHPTAGKPAAEHPTAEKPATEHPR